jgi:hypothetical protein
MESAHNDSSKLIIPSQTNVRNQLVKFLEISLAQENKETKMSAAQLADRQAYIELLAENHRRGLCFSFSLTRAAMRMIKKSNWWIEALSAVANWKGDVASLSKPIMLADSDSKDPVTLESIFKRVLNYIITNQGTPKRSTNEFFIQGVNQSKMLSPDPIEEKTSYRYFEILSGNEILRVQHRKKIAGNFTFDQLKSIFSKSNLEKNMCLIHSGDHTLEIGFENGKFVVYNSSYKDKFEMCDTQEKVIREVMKLMQDIPVYRDEVAICIEMATCDAKAEPIVFPAFESKVKKNPAELLKGLGLNIIARETPELLETIIQNAIASNNPNLPEIILEGLTSHVNGSTGFHAVATFTPHLLPTLMSLAIKSNKAKDLLPQAILRKDYGGDSGLRMVELCAPKSLKDVKAYVEEYIERKNFLTDEFLLDFVASRPDGPQKIAQALFSISSDNRNGMMTAINYNLLEKAVNYAKSFNGWSDLAADFLTTKDKEGGSGLQFLLYYSHFSELPLNTVMGAVAESKIGAEKMLLALGSTDNDGTTGRALLKEKNYRKYLPKINETFKASLKNLPQSQLIKMKADLEQATEAKSAYHGLLKKSPGFFNNLFSEFSDKNALTVSFRKAVEAEIKLEPKVDNSFVPHGRR